ncbi:transmembrane protein 45B-like [Glandiceps talaboti]
MGTWIGHVLPGTFFFTFGLYWAIRSSYRLIVGNSTKHQNGKSTEPIIVGKWKQRVGKLRRFSAEFWEGVVIICMCVIGVIAELPPKDSFPYRHFVMFNDDEPGRPFIWGNKWQHATMYTFFGIYGVVLVLARTCVTGLRIHEKIFLALAFFVEGLLFYFHVHGRSSLDITIHYMLVITIFFNCIIAAAENWKGDDVLLPFMTACCGMLQGSWFWQTAFTLYPPHGNKWDQESHANVMFVTMAFAWHLAANIFIIAGAYGVVSLCLRSKGIYSVPYSHVGDNEEDEETEFSLIENASDDH